MRADEFLVEKYLELEKQYAEVTQKLFESFAEQEKLTEELADFENLVHILSKHLTVTKFGVLFEFKNYIEEDKADIEYLASYFDVEFKEEPQGEG